MRILLLCYALSGLLSLGYQVVWLRHFVDRFGSSTFTFVLVICCFIAGLGAGAFFSRPVSNALRRVMPRSGNLQIYGIFEILIATTVLLVYAESLIPADLMGTFPYVLKEGIYEPLISYQLLKIPLAVLSVAVPCFFMGVTYPLLCNVFVERVRFPSSLYAWNTLGACSSVLLCEWVLLRQFGTDATLVVMIVANALLGLFFLAKGGRIEERCKEEPPDEAPLRATSRPAADSSSSRATKNSTSPAAAPLTYGVLIAGAVISGFLSGALEADAFRRIHFVQIYNGSAMAFVSFWAIAAIFLASRLVHRCVRWRLVHLKVWAVVGLGVFLVIMNYLLAPVAGWLQEFSGTSAERFSFDRDGSLMINAAVFAVTGLAVFPSYFCVSLLLPFLCNAGQTQGRHLGRIYGLNTIAFLAGMIVFSWVAPLVNMFFAFKLLTATFAILVVFLLLLKRSGKILVLQSVAAASAVGVAAFLTPSDFDRDFFLPSDRLHKTETRCLKGSTGFSTFVAEFPHGDAVFLDSGQMSDTGPQAKRYMKIMCHFPLLAQPQPRKALLICFGVGNTGGAIAKHSCLERIDVVDLSRNIMETAPEFAFHNDRVFDDPRLRQIHDDGRSYLAVTDERYDLITSEPPPPLMHGISRLYSLEYYEDVVEHLTPRGCMTQWLPIYQMPPKAGRLIVATFVRAFPHVLLITGFDREFILVGSKSPIDVETMADRFARDPRVLGDLHTISVPSPAHLMARIVMTDADLRKIYGQGPVVTDQKNLLSSYWPGGRVLDFPYSPRAVLAMIPPSLTAAEPGLRKIFTDLRALRRHVPDFPAEVLATVSEPPGAVAGTEIDWVGLKGLNLQAEKALRQGRVREGLGLFGNSTAQNPVQMDVYLSVGWNLIDLKRPAVAAQWFAKCTALFPEYQEGHYYLGLALGQAGRTDKAIASLRRALEINPLYYEALLVLGKIMGQKGARTEAVANLQKALDLKPMSDDARRALDQALRLRE